MASPQKEEGYVAIANELYDVLNMIKLTQYQRDAIRLVIRLSYGCRQKSCQFKAWRDFQDCVGLHKTQIKRVLQSLEDAKIFVIDWTHKIIHLNKNYATWKVDVCPLFKAESYAGLIEHNVKNRFKIGAIGKSLTELKFSNNELSSSVIMNSGNQQSSVILNSELLNTELRVQYLLTAAGVMKGKTGAEVRDISNRSNRSNKNNKDNIEGTREEKFKWVCGLFQNTAPGWAPANDLIIDRVKYICEFPDEQIEKVFTKAMESNIHRNGLMRYVTKGLDNYGSLYERKEKGDGGKDRGSGEDYRGHGRGSSKSDRGSKGGVEESRWAEIDRQLFGEDEGEEDG